MRIIKILKIYTIVFSFLVQSYKGQAEIQEGIPIGFELETSAFEYNPSPEEQDLRHKKLAILYSPKLFLQDHPWKFEHQFQKQNFPSFQDHWVDLYVEVDGDSRAIEFVTPPIMYNGHADRENVAALIKNINSFVHYIDAQSKNHANNFVQWDPDIIDEFYVSFYEPTFQMYGRTTLENKVYRNKNQKNITFNPQITVQLRLAEVPVLFEQLIKNDSKDDLSLVYRKKLQSLKQLITHGHEEQEQVWENYNNLPDELKGFVCLLKYYFYRLFYTYIKQTQPGYKANIGIMSRVSFRDMYHSLSEQNLEKVKNLFSESQLSKQFPKYYTTNTNKKIHKHVRPNFSKIFSDHEQKLIENLAYYQPNFTWEDFLNSIPPSEYYEDINQEYTDMAIESINKETHHLLSLKDENQEHDVQNSLQTIQETLENVQNHKKRSYDLLSPEPFIALKTASMGTLNTTRIDTQKGYAVLEFRRLSNKMDLDKISTLQISDDNTSKHEKELISIMNALDKVLEKRKNAQRIDE